VDVVVAEDVADLGEERADHVVHHHVGRPAAGLADAAQQQVKQLFIQCLGLSPQASS